MAPYHWALCAACPIPAVGRDFEQVGHRYARWDLSCVDLIDPQDNCRTLTDLRPPENRTMPSPSDSRCQNRSTLTAVPDKLKGHKEHNLPVENLRRPPEIGSIFWRLKDQLPRDGGFDPIDGASPTYTQIS